MADDGCSGPEDSPLAPKEQGSSRNSIEAHRHRWLSSDHKLAHTTLPSPSEPPKTHLSP